MIYIYILHSKTRGPILNSANLFLSRFVEETIMPFSLSKSVVFVLIIKRAVRARNTLAFRLKTRAGTQNKSPDEKNQ